jgi:hypothetical protein
LVIQNPNGTTTTPGIVGQEPVVIINAMIEVITELIRNAVLLFVGFSIVDWSDVQIALIMAVVGSFLAAIKVIANIVFVRPQTTPVANPTVPQGTIVNVQPDSSGAGGGTVQV